MIGRNPWRQFPKLGGTSRGRQRGPWAMSYGALPGTFGVMVSIDSYGGVALSAALFGRAGIVGYMPVKPWKRPRRSRRLKVGRES